MIAVISLFLLWLYFHVRGLSCNQEPGFVADNLATAFRNFPLYLFRPIVNRAYISHLKVTTLKYLRGKAGWKLSR